MDVEQTAATEPEVPAPGQLADCDLIMKGGITSGVVYPRAATHLAQKYRFRNLGGASAGAIAAAFVAAAEYGRASGGFDQARRDPHGAGLATRHVFQPSAATAPMHRVLLAFIAEERHQGVRRWQRLVRRPSVGRVGGRSSRSAPWRWSGSGLALLWQLLDRGPFDLVGRCPELPALAPRRRAGRSRCGQLAGGEGGDASRRGQWVRPLRRTQHARPGAAHRLDAHPAPGSRRPARRGAAADLRAAVGRGGGRRLRQVRRRR